MKHPLLLLLFTCSSLYLLGQQTIRGTVIDQQTLTPLIGARVILLDSEPLKGANTDSNGDFRITDVPVGRHAIQISYYGYEPVLRSNLIVNAAQELVLEVGMEEKVTSIDEVVISSEGDKKRNTQ